MIKLSDRLQVIADEIKQGETVADIGTDHGLLPIFLYESGRSPRVILGDINQGPLEKAKENIAIHFGADALDSDGNHACGGALDLRLGSGLEPVASGETDVVVIAGMGGILMTEILGHDLNHAKSFRRLILQPRNGSHKLRWWLLQNGFQITAEHLVVERKYICEIMTVEPEKRTGTDVIPLPEDIPDETLDLEISPLLYESKDPLLVSFIKNKIRIEENVVGFVAEGTGEGEGHERIAAARKRLAALYAKLENAEAVMNDKTTGEEAES
ncbi:MAG: SAM-dependent methyltransferase [Firmicutes bacterium]|nr:SAM-dependent methyltransferase [Bacillota bacterium]